MPEPLKHMYNRESLQALARDVRAVYPAFSVEGFLETAMDGSWPDLELKARGRRISSTLGSFLTSDFERDIALLDKIVANYSGFFGIIFPDFVEVFGQDEVYWDISIPALERYTPYSSSEFAVRPFIIDHEERMMAQMYVWARHENEHVRRLSSEGCRPQLPWGRALPRFKEDPTPILPILKQLKADPSMYVRKSVANNINDISKTNPGVVLRLAEEWLGQNEFSDWVIKHGCRTLLKKGNVEVLALFGYHGGSDIVVEDFRLESDRLSIGDNLVFAFTIRTDEATKVRLEYGIDYVKATGKTSRKIFKISETTMAAGERKDYAKTHSFANVSIRKHHPGTHAIALIVNGEERGTLGFELQAQILQSAL